MSVVVVGCAVCEREMEGERERDSSIVFSCAVRYREREKERET